MTGSFVLYAQTRFMKFLTFYDKSLQHHVHIFYLLYGRISVFRSTLELSHDKSNKIVCAPNEDSDQPGHPPSLIRIFAVRMKKSWVLSYPLHAVNALIRLGGCTGWSESSLGAQSLCWFCHEAAHLYSEFHSQSLGGGWTERWSLESEGLLWLQQDRERWMPHVAFLFSFFSLSHLFQRVFDMTAILITRINKNVNSRDLCTFLNKSYNMHSTCTKVRKLPFRKQWFTSPQS